MATLGQNSSHFSAQIRRAISLWLGFGLPDYPESFRPVMPQKLFYVKSVIFQNVTLIISDFVTGLASENEKRNSIEATNAAHAHAHRRQMALAAAAAASGASGESSSRDRANGLLLLPSGVILRDVYRPPRRLQVRILAVLNSIQGSQLRGLPVTVTPLHIETSLSTPNGISLNCKLLSKLMVKMSREPCNFQYSILNTDFFQIPGETVESEEENEDDMQKDMKRGKMNSDEKAAVSDLVPNNPPAVSPDRQGEPVKKEDFPSPKEQVPNQVEKVPIPEQRAPMPDEPTPSPGISVPTPEERVTSPEERVPSPEERAPSTGERVISPEEIVLSPEERVPSPEERVPSPEQCAPNPEESSSTSEECVRSPGDEVISSDDEGPASEEQVPSPEEYVPSLEEQVPSPEEELPEERVPSPEGRAPSSEERVPSPEETVPSPEERVPSPEETLLKPECADESSSLPPSDKARGEAASGPSSYSSYLSRRRMSGASGYAAIAGLLLDDSPLPPRRGFRRVTVDSNDDDEERVSEECEKLFLCCVKILLT